MASYVEHILNAEIYAEMCNEDCLVSEFCKHLDLTIENLKQAKRTAPLATRRSIKSDLHNIEQNIQNAYHDLIDRCHHHYWGLAHKRAMPNKNAFAEEINIIFSRLNKTNKAYATECIKDIEEYFQLLHDIDNSAMEAKRLEQKRKAEAQERAKQNEEFKRFLDSIAEDECNWIREQQGLPSIDCELERIDGMEGLQFEHWCADILKRNGFCGVSVTRGSGDQGVDVLATKDNVKYAIQCKCYHSDLGNSPVQEINTGKVIYRCHVGAVMTNRYFTSGAKEAAEATGVLLWDRDKLVEFMSNAK